MCKNRGGYCTLAMLKYNLPDVRSSGKREWTVWCRFFLANRILGSQEDGRERTPSTAANRESVYNRNKQQHENSVITPQTANRLTSTTSPDVNVAARLGSAAPAGGSLGPPMGGSLTAGELDIKGADLNHRRLPIKLPFFRPL
ncbi:conserved hypothetical protein [Trichinella spiralis]|uniref:hypothetical protein n=1 Tax=Trichinella spiralis TaxID=6334 RepID=UPI0001EFCD75|nr:conserved hypothetical protein [Trichinella spiralis]